MVWAPVCGTYLRCRTLEVQCVVWVPVCGAMSSVPHTGGPVWSGRCQQDHIRAALSSPSLSQPPRACSLLPRPMLECAHAIRASKDAHNFCVFGHKLLQAAWPGKQGAGSARNTCAVCYADGWVRLVDVGHEALSARTKVGATAACLRATWYRRPASGQQAPAFAGEQGARGCGRRTSFRLVCERKGAADIAEHCLKLLEQCIARCASGGT